MQVQRKPAIWPYILVLMALLGLCLAVPHYWHLQEAADENRAAQPRRAFRIVKAPSTGGLQVFLPASSPEPLPPPPPQRVVYIPPFPNEPLTLRKPYSSPSYQLLLAPTDRQPSLAPVLSPTGYADRQSSLDDAFPGLDAAASVRKLGQLLANFQPALTVHKLAERAANKIDRLPTPPQVSQTPPVLKGPVLITLPEQRLAMIPGRVERRPKMDLPRPTPPKPEPIAVEQAGRLSGKAWASASALMSQIERLQRHTATAHWATAVLAELDVLRFVDDLPAKDVDRQLKRLDALLTEVDVVADSVLAEAVQTELLRAKYSLSRRLDTWSLAYEIGRGVQALPHARSHGQERLQNALDQFASIAARSDRGIGWQDYLLVEPLAGVSNRSGRMTDLERRRLAEQIMARVTTGRLTAAQRRFVSSEPVAALTNELRCWVDQPVHVERLAMNLENYEETGSPRLAREIAQDRRKLEWSADPVQRRLASRIENNYRNANLRLAITEELLNRLLPQSADQEYSRVRDCIVGTPVKGHSWTDSRLRARLLPDENFIRIGLEAHGNVASNTVADGGAAHLYSHGQTSFSAHKLVMVTHDGMKVWPSIAEARNENRLRKIRTKYDGIPLVGSWVRSEAQDEYRKKRPWARSEVEMKVADQAKTELDDRAGGYLKDLEERVQEQIDELSNAGIHTQPIALSTTNERIVARLRIAGDDQLAAHTPRNRAPSDSLASLQVHESVLSNIISRLDLDGQRLNADELQDLLRERISRLQTEPPEDVPASTVFHFDYEDAIRFQIHDGQLELTIGLLELVHDRRPVRRFKVHAFYQPVIDGLNVSFVRDGALGIEGRLRATDRGRLHAVFNKILVEDEVIPVFDESSLGEDLNWDGLMITQAVLEDGWLGLAIGPETPGRKAQLERCLR